MTINDLVNFVKENSAYKAKKWIVKNTSIIIFHPEKWDWYKYVILVLSAIIIFFVFLKAVTIYSYKTLIFNFLSISVLTVLISIFTLIYLSYQKPILEINFRNKIITRWIKKLFFSDVIDFYFKKEYYINVWKIIENKYNIFMKLPEEELNIIEIKWKEKAEEFNKILKILIR